MKLLNSVTSPSATSRDLTGTFSAEMPSFSFTTSTFSGQLLPSVVQMLHLLVELWMSVVGPLTFVVYLLHLAVQLRHLMDKLLLHIVWSCGEFYHIQ